MPMKSRSFDREDGDQVPCQPRGDVQFELGRTMNCFDASVWK
jgi:hypothetical protein